MRRLLLLSTLLAAACYAVAGGLTSVDGLETRPFDPPASGRMEPRGAVIVRLSDDLFGGFSGFVLDGTRLTAVSDKGGWGNMTLRFDGGRLADVEAASVRWMTDAAGLSAEDHRWDPEGLARLPDGRLLVSFEQDHRLQVFDSDVAPAGPEYRDPSWEEFDGNSGLEGLAVDADGVVWAILEQTEEGDDPFPVFVGPVEGPWEAKRLPRRGDYLPTGADFGPDGWLYVTERDFSVFSGFATRVRRFRWGAGPDPVAEEELGDFPSSAGLDNVEGIAVWRSEAGETMILLLSDDNYAAIEDTVLSLFVLR